MARNATTRARRVTGQLTIGHASSGMNPRILLQGSDELRDATSSDYTTAIRDDDDDIVSEGARRR